MLAFVGIIPRAFAQEDRGTTAWQEQDYFDVILELKRDRQTLSRAFFALEKDGKYFIPLQELARTLEFQLDISLDEGLSEGFFLSADNRFEINFLDYTYTINGETTSFSQDRAAIIRQQFGIGDFYLQSDLINEIFDLDLIVNPLLQTAVIQTKQKLPYELAESREQNRNRLLNKYRDKQGRLERPDNLQKIPNQYKSFSFPAVDVSTFTSIGGPADDFTQRVNLRGKNDLLFTEADYNLTLLRDPDDGIDVTSSRLTFERQSYDEGDLPAGLQLVQAGDIRPNTSRLIRGVLEGTGVLISTESQKQTVNFDQVVIEGTADPGWEVELYRNNELIGFQAVDDNGEYRFEDVTINFSKTVIRVVLYGPQGQVEEREEVYSISNQMIKPGENVFEANILNLNESLLFQDESLENRPNGLAGNIQYKRGINKYLSAFTTLSRLPTEDDTRNYATVGVSGGVGDVSGLAEIYKDFSGGMAYDFRAASQYKGLNINLRTAFYDDFESPRAQFDEDRRSSETDFSIGKTVKTFLGHLGFRFRFDHNTFEEDPDSTQYDISQSYGNSGLRITHANQFNYLDGDQQSIDGRVNATYRIDNNWLLRGQMNYDVEPNQDIRNIITELRYKNDKKFFVAGNVEQDFMDDSTTLGAEASYDFGRLRAGFDLEWNSETDFRGIFRTAYSFAPYGLDDDYLYKSQTLSGRSALNARIFKDKNSNLVFDEGDEPLEDAKLNVGRRSTPITDEFGVTSYISPPRNDYEDITVDVDTLQNPYYIPAINGYEVVLRSGQNQYLEFPIIETGLIDGTVSTNQGPLAGVRIQLLQDGNLLETTSTAFDGYYVFEYIEPGQYIVQIDPSYDQINIPPKEISVTPENLFQNGIDFQIFEQASGSDCADEKTSDGRITQDCLHNSAQDGMLQPAHMNSKSGPALANMPAIENIRMAQRPDFLRMVLDFDLAPNPYMVSQDADTQNITITLKGTQWQVSESWENMAPQFISGYRLENLANGDTKIVIEAVDTIQIKKSETLEPNDPYGHRIYFDFTK
ncbi:MAG: carboxypeptidase-like regulatory domain-containing protein [Pseudomonadota bacterium]